MQSKVLGNGYKKRCFFFKCITFSNKNFVLFKADENKSEILVFNLVWIYTYLMMICTQRCVSIY